jgi:hypothetical protein
LRRRETALANESTQRINQMLNRLITVYKQGYLPGGRRGTQEGSGRDNEERKVHDPPKSLEFADHHRLNLLAGEHTTFYLITDGPDNILSRKKRPGVLTFTIDGSNIATFQFSKNEMRNGKLPIHMMVSNTATSGQGGKIIASLEILPNTILTTSRELRVIPLPPPYVGIDPPTKFEFAKNTAMTIEVGRRSITEIHTDARNDLLTRAVRPARISGLADIDNMFISIRGPRDGIAQLEVNTSSKTQIGAEGLITAKLILDDGTIFEATRPVKVIESQPHQVSTGSQPSSIPAYQLKRVWQQLPEGNTDDITWNDVDNYNSEKVGHWEPNGDELWLYVNMDERLFQAERIKWGRRFGEGTSDRLTDRYVAYIAFHFFQLYEFSQKTSSIVSKETGNENSFDEREEEILTYEPESPFVIQELRRVAATLIQTLRSEAELARMQEEES